MPAVVSSFSAASSKVAASPSSPRSRATAALVSLASGLAQVVFSRSIRTAGAEMKSFQPIELNTEDEDLLQVIPGRTDALIGSLAPSCIEIRFFEEKTQPLRHFFNLTEIMQGPDQVERGRSRPTQRRSRSSGTSGQSNYGLGGVKDCLASSTSIPRPGIGNLPSRVSRVSSPPDFNPLRFTVGASVEGGLSRRGGMPQT